MKVLTSSGSPSNADADSLDDLRDIKLDELAAADASLDREVAELTAARPDGASDDSDRDQSYDPTKDTADTDTSSSSSSSDGEAEGLGNFKSPTGSNTSTPNPDTPRQFKFAKSRGRRKLTHGHKVVTTRKVACTMPNCNGEVVAAGLKRHMR